METIKKFFRRVDNILSYSTKTTRYSLNWWFFLPAAIVVTILCWIF